VFVVASALKVTREKTPQARYDFFFFLLPVRRRQSRL
jgi:hypothetical protein